jgi:hypothetical protein
VNVHIYVEGGGRGKESKAALRNGFAELFSTLREAVLQQHGEFRIILCGDRDATYRDFMRATRTDPDVFNVLLVDAESAVSSLPREHLLERDKWNYKQAGDDQYHLMVETMESWIISDRNALMKFYGNDFKESAIPRRDDVENLMKAEVSKALTAATKPTQKGEYHKIQHGPKLLAMLDVAHLREVAPHCDRLFATVLEKINT